MQLKLADIREESRFHAQRVREDARTAKDGPAMKIQCQSCQAKYTIADEKVLGKVVKIRCKKCSATIVINGNETRPVEDNAETHVFDYAGQANDPWTVNVADGDQRTMTGQEIAAEYRTGTVTDETYCWKDGMADWLPLREIEPLYGLVKLGARGPSHSLHDDDMSVQGHSSPPVAQPGNVGALFSANEVASAVDSPFAGSGGSGTNGNGNGYRDDAHAAPVAAASAARRGGGRGQGADLFGNVASAGGEEDVMTSAVAGNAGHGGGGGGGPMGGGGGGGMEEQKLTGQRNESSVLFSLSALTEGGKSEAAAPNRTTATADGSGLIDIRALSQSMGSDDKKDTNARVDDIMNLSGGGAFGAALAAPILAPPPLEMSTYGGDLDGGAGKSNKMLFIAIIAGAALIAIGIVSAVLLTRPSIPSETATPGATPSGLATSPNGGLAMNDPSGMGTGNAPAATSDNTPPPPGTGNANSKAPTVTGAAPKAPSGGGGGQAAAAPKEQHVAAEPAMPKAPEQPKDFGSALAAAAGKPAQEAPSNANAGGSSAPFDRGAAQGALGGVNVQSCKKSDGPTGSGHVKITFAPNGSVSAAVVDGGPFPGTAVGGCIAGKFRGAHVPPFSGGPVSVGKSFTLN
jgi:predicted Zn finger-like uncharacterized protein